MAAAKKNTSEELLNLLISKGEELRQAGIKELELSGGEISRVVLGDPPIQWPQQKQREKLNEDGDIDSDPELDDLLDANPLNDPASYGRQPGDPLPGYYQTRRHNRQSEG